MLCFLQSFWNGSQIIANLGSNRSGIDSNAILASNHNFDPEGDCDDSTFQPCSPRALATHKTVTDSFRSVYPINSGIGQGKAVAVGRYPEDVYFDGNPWYVTTLAAAEQLYSAIHQWQRAKRITITSISLPFFQDIYQFAAEGSYPSWTIQYYSIIWATKEYADGYMDVAVSYQWTDLILLPLPQAIGINAYY